MDFALVFPHECAFSGECKGTEESSPRSVGGIKKKETENSKRTKMLNNNGEPKTD